MQGWHRKDTHTVTKALLVVIAIKAALLLFGSRRADEPLMKPGSHGQAHTRTGTWSTIGMPIRAVHAPTRSPSNDPPKIPASAGQHDSAPSNNIPPLDEDWARVVQDWLLPFHPEITSRDINDTFRLDPGEKVLFQHIKRNLYVLDPGAYCSAPPVNAPYLKSRCSAIYYSQYFA